jgi:hypothetical protein
VQLKVHAARDIGAPPEKVFDFAVANENMPRIMQRFGPIPAVASVEVLDGAKLAAGVKRRVRMADQSEIIEEVLVLDRPRHHRYRWLTAPAPPFSLLVRSATGDWVFTASAKGTHLDVTYTFELTSPLAAPIAAAVLVLFKRWVQRGLSRIEPFVHG